MSIFNKAPGDRPTSRAEAGPAPEGAMSVIGAGMRIVGDVESTGVIKVEGVVEGAVRTTRQLLLGRSGEIHGDITAADAVLGGKVVGTVNTSERVEIQGTAAVEGDIHTRSIVVLEGGTINGAVHMGESPTRGTASAASATRVTADT